MDFCLRNETKPHEMRKILPPSACKKLAEFGHKVFIEKSTNCIYRDSEYEKLGLTLVESNSWKQAPKETIILGLKELPEEETPLIHSHIYFAHAYKGQPGWQNILSRFKQGEGKLFDLEYLVDENNRRVSAFGYWAGYVGAAVGYKLIQNPKSPLEPYYKDKNHLASELKKSNIKAIVIGALGRSGTGAKDFLKPFCEKVDLWDLEETKIGGPFPQLLEYDLIINCVLSNRKIPPFLTQELVDQSNKSSMLVDVSCDPGGEFNTLPLYNEATKIDKPIIQNKNLSIIAIDNLPSLLPRESSEDFASQLLPYLLELDESKGVWRRSYSVFQEHIRSL